MVDVLLAALVVALLGAVALGLLVAVTVVPFVVTLLRADRRGVSSVRAGALALATSLLGPAAAGYLALRTSAPLGVAVLPLLVVVAGPAVVEAAPRGLGRRGRHEARTV